jgi:hypothetical protein
MFPAGRQQTFNMSAVQGKAPVSPVPDVAAYPTSSLLDLDTGIATSIRSSPDNVDEQLPTARPRDRFLDAALGQ